MPLLNIRQKLDVQLGPSVDYPNGRVVQLGPREPGDSPWIECDDEEVLAHPLVSRLIDTGSEGKRQVGLRDAMRARDEAIAKANGDYAAAVGKINMEIAADHAKEAEEWQARKEKAADEGKAFTETHPDPSVATEIARTGAPSATPTATMKQADWPDGQPPRNPIQRRGDAQPAAAPAADKK